MAPFFYCYYSRFLAGTAGTSPPGVRRFFPDREVFIFLLLPLELVLVLVLVILLLLLGVEAELGLVGSEAPASSSETLSKQYRR